MEIEKPKTDEELRRFRNGSPKATESLFRLPRTHQVISSDLSEEQLRFAVLAYGFLNGLYLTPENYACIRKVPYEEGKLSPLLLVGNDYEMGLGKISQFLRKSDASRLKAMTAALHWFLVGQSYEFEWDRFDAQYKVLDAIHKLSGLKSSSHAERPIDLVDHYGLILPDWAKNDSPKGSKPSSKVSRIRNNLFHEAVYAEMPIGYAYPKENYDLEFVSLNVKLIAATLGIDTPYLQANPNDRSRWAWDMK